MASSSTVSRLAIGVVVFFVAAGAVGALKALDYTADHTTDIAPALSSALIAPDDAPVDESVSVSKLERRGEAKSNLDAETNVDAEPNVVAEPSVVAERGDSPDGSAELVAPMIDEWLPEARRCRRRGRRRYCDGPRHIPAPHGADAERAQRLGLGSRRTYDRILSGPADASLLAEAGSPEESLLWPVPEGVRGRGFGYVRRRRLRERLHRGVDIPAAVGALVRSTNEGLVIYADNEVRGYGNLVVILHGDDTRTLYAHLERAYVFAGQSVARGEVIGAVGRTGMTRAPHLHFEWRRRAIPRNPARRFVDRPDEETERRLYHDQLVRRREGQARLAERREARERRQARRAQQQARENLRAERARPVDSRQSDPSTSSQKF